MVYYFFFLTYFILIIFSVTVYVALYGTIGLLLSLILAHVDNRQNEKKDVALYIIYPLASAISLFIFIFIFYLMSGRIVNISRLFLLIIPLICVIPGYFTIRIYQSIVNRKLENKYWEEYDKTH